MSRKQLLEMAKPILFNTEMVQAILKNKKTVTRRIVKYYGRTPTMDGKDKFYKIDENLNGTNPNRLYAGFYNDNDVFEYKGETMIDALYYPLYFKVGDILYVRETWQEVFETEYGRDRPFNIRELITNFDEIDKIRAGLSTQCSRPSDPAREKYYVFKASNIRYADSKDCLRWKPSIHMPKAIARIFLKVTDVRVERLQDITKEQALKEGISVKWDNGFDRFTYPWEEFMNTWNSTIKKQDLDRYGWEANPWVWVIEFEKGDMKC